MNLRRWPAATGRWLLNNRLSTRIIELLDSRSSNRMNELGAIAAAVEFTQINKVRGDYLEFGLWQGKTFSYAHRMKRRYRVEDMLLWGFDSFQGLPPIDDERDNIWQGGDFRCSEPELRRILRRKGLDEREYRLVPGYYHESLDNRAHLQLEGRSAAIVYIDCDLYDSTVQVLNFVARYLVNGTIVCFDDYYCYKAAPDQGEQQALSEFLRANPGFRFLPWLDYCPVGKAFIVRVAGA